LSDICRRQGLSALALQHIHSWREIIQSLDWKRLQESSPEGTDAWEAWALGADILEDLGMWDEALEWDEEAAELTGTQSFQAARREVLRLRRAEEYEVR
jgi:hypothetical protein